MSASLLSLVKEFMMENTNKKRTKLNSKIQEKKNQAIIKQIELDKQK